MSTLELVLNMLAEATTIEISKEQTPQTFEENKLVAHSCGEAAGEARRAVEKRTGKPVITAKGAVDFSRLLSDTVEDSDNDLGKRLINLQTSKKREVPYLKSRMIWILVYQMVCCS